MIKDVSLPVSNKIICGLIWCVFVALSLYIAPYHEVWADEVQAFLIARDASVADIISSVPHQEGQPSLWHLVLKGLIFVFGENLNITYVSIFIMSLTVGIFLFLYNVPLLYKILIPFGHYFLYQYNIISRNYCLAYLALALLGYLYPLRHKYIWRYAFVLLLLAESSSFFAPVAAFLGGIWLYEAYTNHSYKLTPYIAPLFMLACFGLLMIWQIFPINMVQYEMRIEYIKNYPYNVIAHFPESFFAGKNMILNLCILGWIAICAIKTVLSLDFYKNISRYRATVLPFFLIWISFIAGYFAIHPMYYHQGAVWGLFLCSMYMFFPNYCRQRNHFLFILCLFIQIFWSYASISYDIKHPYSSQFEIMKVLQKHNLTDHKIQAIGFHTLPFQILHTRDNLYISDDTPLYWLWTQKDMQIKGGNMQQQLDLHRDIVVVDIDDAKDADFSYYLRPDEFYIYKIPAAAVYKGFLFYEQGVFVFIKKDYFYRKTNS